MSSRISAQKVYTTSPGKENLRSGSLTSILILFELPNISKTYKIARNEEGVLLVCLLTRYVGMTADVHCTDRNAAFEG